LFFILGRAGKLNIFKIWVLFLVLICFALSTGKAGTFREYQIKAAFIYNFIKFIEWPNQKAFDTFNICILGKDPFGEAIDILKGKRVKGWKIKILRMNSLEKAESCQVIFISPSEASSLKEILSFFKNKPILTISEIPGFIEKGGIINFIIINNKIRFEINDKVAREGGLKISSKLLRLARKVIK